MKYFIVASLLAATVSALGPADIPSCALSCALSTVGDSAKAGDFSKCKTPATSDNVLSDQGAQACLCQTPKFQAAFSECAKTVGKCSQADQCLLWANSQKGCKELGTTLPDSLAPAGCGAPAGGNGGSTTTSAAAPPADTGKPAPTESSGSAPAETSAPAESTGAPSYGGGSTTVATEPTTAAGNGTAPTASPSYTPSSASTVVLSGAAAVFAGLVAMLTL